MNKPKVTVGVILYKDTKYLAYSLTSLLDQDYGNIEFIFRDQSPESEVYAYLEESHPGFFKKAKITKGENLMHSGGHNEMMRHMKGEYYVCASNDMFYPADTISGIVEAMESSAAKVATCKLMKWDYEKVIGGDLEASKTHIIDSLGISMTRGHHFFDAGQGKDERDLTHLPKVIGPSGALAVYHQDALKEVGFKNEKGKMEYFDELMHYKNDVDLAYRLSWAGLPCLTVDTRVYHDRQVGRRSDKSKWEIESSLRGHLITLQKNFDPGFSRGVKFRTWLNLKLRFLYILLKHPSSLKVYGEVKELKHKIEKRKRAVKRKVSPKDIESLMV